MWRKVILAGLVSWVAMMIIVFVANGIFGFRARIDFNRPTDEQAVYATLQQNISAPGRYICNPSLTVEHAFPGGEPVYSILYSGVGHETAGRGQTIYFLSALVLTMLVAVLLSMTSSRVMSSYGLRVMFVFIIGIVLAVSGKLSLHGIDGYPFGDALKLALFDVALWVTLGLIMGAIIRPAATSASR